MLFPLCCCSVLTGIFHHFHPHTHFSLYSRRGCCCWGCSLTRWPEMTWCLPGLPPLPSGWARRRSAPCAGLLRLWTGSFRPWRTALDPRRRLITGAFLSVCSFVSSNKKSPSGIPVMVWGKRLPFRSGRLWVTWRGTACEHAAGVFSVKQQECGRCPRPASTTKQDWISKKRKTAALMARNVRRTPQCHEEKNKKKKERSTTS